MDKLNHEILKPLLNKLYPYGYSAEPLDNANRFIGFGDTGSTLYIQYVIRDEPNEIVVDYADDPDQAIYIEFNVEYFTERKVITKIIKQVREFLPELKYYHNQTTSKVTEDEGVDLSIVFGSKITK